jgi:hypothetical protein
VRCTSKAGLLEQVALLGATTKQLGARRTLNKRRLEDACHADQRAAVAQQKAGEARTAAKAQAARADDESARADAAEEELAVVTRHSWLCSYMLYIFRSRVSTPDPVPQSE